ncbi:MAG: hypothetical protein R3248_07590 [Candidatus Promineifilaceae bacterium]|nr:hypothetical protein [Candidatus Promineifilaceae bacterium]
MRRFILLLILFVLVGAGFFFLLRSDDAAAYGPAVTVCPGPDRYGYVCEDGASVAYVDATNDTQLYEDDGVVELALPFPFTFYGTTYNSAWASTNGVLQFATQNAAYENDCLDQGPAPEMGDMIAAYWDDLDLRLAGFLETETVGEAPERIFVIEWEDVPPVGGVPSEGVTFAIQLFEGSNDVVLFYRDVATTVGGNGSSATVGIQSEAQGLALQFSCNNASLGANDRVRFRHPEVANEGLKGGAATTAEADGATPATPKASADAATLLARFNRLGTAGLPRLRAAWLSESPGRAFAWQQADVTGDGREELVALWRGPALNPELAELAVLTPEAGQGAGHGAEGEMALLFNDLLSTRRQPVARPAVQTIADVTGDGAADVLLHDAQSGQGLVFSTATGTPTLQRLPETCGGRLAVREATGDGILDVVGDDCGRAGRATFTWQGAVWVER